MKWTGTSFDSVKWDGRTLADRGRGGQTTSGNGQAWSSPSPRGQWRTGKNGGNWLWNHQWCPKDPRGERVVEMRCDEIPQTRQWKRYPNRFQHLPAETLLSLSENLEIPGAADRRCWRRDQALGKKKKKKEKKRKKKERTKKRANWNHNIWYVYTEARLPVTKLGGISR